jgi:Tol biopolymer transport system component
MVLVGAVACSSSTSPNGKPTSGITFVAGDNQTDTIGAVLNQALDISITRTPGGQSLAGQVVQFIAILDSAGSAYEVQPEALNAAAPQPFVAESLPANGQASVVIVMGTKAGPARLIVKIPGFSFTDTARFTVTPGKATTVTVSPVDTTIIIGSSTTLHVSTEDRAGNGRSDSVQLAVASGPATISAKTVTTTAFGRIAIVTSDGTAADTTHVSSVPSGTVAASTGSGIAIFNTDGSDFRVLRLGQPVGNIKWAPSGTSFAFDQNGPACYGGGSILQTTDLSGNVKTLDQGVYDAYPSYSRDGTWIYFTSYTSDGGTNRRVHPDGTSDDSLATLEPGLDLWPSSSPDGQQVAYGTYFIGSPNDYVDLRILTISSGAVTDLGIVAWSPEWSPTSNQIAYIVGTRCDAGTMSIVNSDGTGAHNVNPHGYIPSFDWSSDGKWLVALDSDNGLIDVIDASTGNSAPLTFTSNLSSPTWRPTQPSTARFRNAMPVRHMAPRGDGHARGGM